MKEVFGYINARIEAIKDADRTHHDGIWREETPEQRQSRINELENLLDVLKIWQETNNPERRAGE